MENYKFRFLILFTVVAVLSSILRFGQRENDNLSTLSDSDCYIDMAMVFSGEKEAFNPDWIRGLPHHYNRPFFPFVAGLIGHYLLGDDFKSAFSVINIIAAIVIAYILHLSPEVLSGYQAPMDSISSVSYSIFPDGLWLSYSYRDHRTCICFICMLFPL